MIFKDIMLVYENLLLLEEACIKNCAEHTVFEVKPLKNPVVAVILKS